jgi:hypothetical protein
MGKELPKTKLPPERSFKLSHILTHSESGTEDLQRVNDNIINSIDLYNKDIKEQLISLTNVEFELINKINKVNTVYDEVHDLRTKNITDTQINENDSAKDNSKNKRQVKPKRLNISMFGINQNKLTNNKLEKYKKLEENLNELLNETVVQKNRIDTLISRLKKLELNLSKRERLFDEKSANKKHYAKLYNYGMKDALQSKETLKKEREKLDNHKTDDESIQLYQPKIIESKNQPPKKSRQSNSSEVSKISQQKLDQYLDIENQLDTIQKAKSNEIAICDSSEQNITQEITGFNPVLLVSGKNNSTAACKINDETITVRSDIKTLKQSHSENENVASLVDELKKLYN